MEKFLQVISHPLISTLALRLLSSSSFSSCFTLFFHLFINPCSLAASSLLRSVQVALYFNFLLLSLVSHSSLSFSLEQWYTSSSLIESMIYSDAALPCHECIKWVSEFFPLSSLPAFVLQVNLSSIAGQKCLLLAL